VIPDANEIDQKFERDKHKNLVRVKNEYVDTMRKLSNDIIKYILRNPQKKYNFLLMFRSNIPIVSNSRGMMNHMIKDELIKIFRGYEQKNWYVRILLVGDNHECASPCYAYNRYVCTLNKNWNIKIKFEVLLRTYRLKYKVLNEYGYQTPAKVYQNSKCVICLEVFPEVLYEACGHIVCCQACHVKYTIHHHTCPLCREHIVIDGDYVDSASASASAEAS